MSVYRESNAKFYRKLERSYLHMMLVFPTVFVSGPSVALYLADVPWSFAERFMIVAQVFCTTLGVSVARQCNDDRKEMQAIAEHYEKEGT